MNLTVTCPRCHSLDLQRSRRRGPIDHALALLGWWPWRCDDCDRRLHARGRSQLKSTGPMPRPATVNVAQADRPAIAFRTDTVKPHAKVVIAADTYDQLNHILLALDRAINSYQPQAQHQEAEETTYAHR